MGTWASRQMRLPLAIGTASLDPEDGRELFQERLGVFAMWCCILAFAFYVVNVLLAYPAFTATASPLAAARTPTAMFHLLAAAILAAVWFLARFRPWSIEANQWLDAAGVIGSCASFALMGVVTGMRPGATTLDATSGLYSAMLACTNVVLTRAVIVPSTPLRTVILSSLALLPLEVLTAVSVARSAVIGNTAFIATLSMISWAVVAAVVATVGSRVIYGLRRDTAKIKRLGQYTLEEKIGEGAMGIVYRASHVMLRRPTAIKVLPPERTGEEHAERFEREVRLTAQLTHPNTVAIYDYGRTPQGVFYYAMEFLHGIDLAALVRLHGPQPAGRVIHVLQQVCRALAEAHGRGSFTATSSPPTSSSPSAAASPTS